jgi:hypothetical protein
LVLEKIKHWACSNQAIFKTRLRPNTITRGITMPILHFE